MKNFVKTAIALLIFAGVFGSAEAQLQSIEPNFFEMQKKALEFYKDIKTEDLDGKELPESGGYAQFKRWEWFWSQRVSPDGKFPDPMILYNETAKAKSDQLRRLKKQGAAVLSPNVADWKEIGPSGPPIGSGAGRINRVHLNPEFPNNIWVGTAAGGAWLSVDKGQTWTSKTDGIPSMGVSDIATTGSDPNVIYIATGDGDGSGGNIQSPISYSVGVMRSNDGGQTWQPTGLNWQTSNARVIRRLLISPSDPKILLAATNQGVYRSINSGVTWAIVQNGNMYDLEFKPGEPSTVYACSNNAVFRSTNDGLSFQILATGIPNSIGRVALAVTIDNPDAVYALCARSGSWGFGGLYSSINSGQTWQLKSSTPNVLGRALDGSDDNDGAQQGWYDLSIAVSPSNANTVYVGGVNIWKSVNGGQTWAINAHWTGAGGKPYVHADVHDLVTTEDNAALVFAGCDGGIFQTKNNGSTWTDLSNGMGIMQFYRFSTSVGDPYLIIGGAQDNGTNRLKNGKWAQVNGGDGMNCIIDPNNPTVMYASVYNGNIARSQDGGNNFSGFVNSGTTGESGAWVTPFILDPVAQSVVYAGFTNVWKFSSNKWAKISSFNLGSPLYHLAIAPSDNKFIYAGTPAAIRRTSNGGTTWETAAIPAGNITQITVHPTNPRRIWATISSYNGKSVFESNDAGSTWADISDGLPAIPAHCIVYQKNSPDRLYLGTEAGVYYRDNATNQWLPYSDGLPNVIVTGIDIHYGIGKVRAGTYARGIWEGNLVNCNSPAVTVTVAGGKTTICEGDSVKLTANAGFNSYKWSNGATTQSIFVKQSGDYNVVVTDGNGCPGASSATTILVSTKRVPSIRGDVADSSTCEGKPITLDVGFGFTSYKILWSTGDTTRKITVTKPGKYSASATNEAGCVGISSDFIVKAGTAPNKPNISANKDTLIASPATNYQWKINGIDVSGATKQKFIPAPADNGKKVTVMVYNAGGCGTLSDEQIIGSVGVDEGIIAQELQLFPNPTVNMVTMDLTLKSASTITVEITNTTGASVQSLQFQSNNLSIHENISLKEFPAGAYLFTVTAGNQKWVRKIIKE
ncbi:MAG: T9SS type A sorting domain-containing protein [Bacteroidetes bacterium]|nr:T9SS type A sorting domain-containing protein [Bacteroidota bacterium]